MVEAIFFFLGMLWHSRHGMGMVLQHGLHEGKCDGKLINRVEAIWTGMVNTLKRAPEISVVPTTSDPVQAVPSFPTWSLNVHIAVGWALSCMQHTDRWVWLHLRRPSVAPQTNAVVWIPCAIDLLLTSKSQVPLVFRQSLTPALQR